MGSYAPEAYSDIEDIDDPIRAATETTRGTPGPSNQGRSQWRLTLAMTSRAASTALGGGPAAVAGGAAHAQFSLGDQRAGTFVGLVLRIGVGARAAGLGERSSRGQRSQRDPLESPGLASLLRQQSSRSRTCSGPPTRVLARGLRPAREEARGSLGFQLGVLSTDIDETTSPAVGTGRPSCTPTSSPRRVRAALDDKLLIGVGAKYVREDLGEDVAVP